MPILTMVSKPLRLVRVAGVVSSVSILTPPVGGKLLPRPIGIVTGHRATGLPDSLFWVVCQWRLLTRQANCARIMRHYPFDSRGLRQGRFGAIPSSLG